MGGKKEWGRKKKNGEEKRMGKKKKLPHCRMADLVLSPGERFLYRV